MLIPISQPGTSRHHHSQPTTS